MYRPILNCCRPQNTICGEGEEEEEEWNENNGIRIKTMEV